MTPDLAAAMIEHTGKELRRLCDHLDRADNERLFALLDSAVKISASHRQIETVADIVSVLADMLYDGDAQEYLRTAVTDCRFRARELEQEAAEAYAEDQEDEKRRLRMRRGEIV